MALNVKLIILTTIKALQEQVTEIDKAKESWTSSAKMP